MAGSRKWANGKSKGETGPNLIGVDAIGHGVPQRDVEREIVAHLPHCSD
jgi:hypothetical protein